MYLGGHSKVDGPGLTDVVGPFQLDGDFAESDIVGFDSFDNGKSG